MRLEYQVSTFLLPGIITNHLDPVQVPRVTIRLVGREYDACSVPLLLSCKESEEGAIKVRY
jgi:hypothetical protein